MVCAGPGGVSPNPDKTARRVVVLRGHMANPWDLHVFEDLSDDWDVSVPVTRSNRFDTSGLRLAMPKARAFSDLAPGPLRAFAAGAPVNRYLGLRKLLADADVVHAAELGFWFTAQAARLKAQLGFRLVVTVWETIPFLEVYRHPVTRRLRRQVLATADLYLAATERAREGLLLEGVPADHIVVCPPGIDIDRFQATPRSQPEHHIVVSPGRLVWEKGHQDVLRAVAALRMGLVSTDALPRLLVVGEGPEEKRLRAYASELGIAEVVEWRRSVPYQEMPAVYAGASAMVLASLPIPNWEEQFGMVLAEAMAAGLPIVASQSGSIPEVLGPQGTYFFPGDWMGIARELANGPLARPAGERVRLPEERIRRFSAGAAAARLDEAYRRVLD
jgi:glycosyltransferase involved in cell wall biosynthesis